MSIAPMPISPRARAGRIAVARSRPPPSAGQLARRRRVVSTAKRLLPLVALALLTVVAMWPELGREVEQARQAYHRGGLVPESGQLTDARYHGLDERNEPYTLTAATARQSGADRIDMTMPKADLNQESGGWLMVQAKTGVFLQKSSQLDLSGEVTLYRDDGSTLTTDAAAVDFKAGAAASAEQTHVEGPFGTLDAQGFTVTDRGGAIQFLGPGRLVLNGRDK